ncbi:CPBP family intramembrane glutamic endopeptidase [Facklamia sp. 7083-14-GEN3]|uniref:CPBP family intramembrane glutamic endopeptidase n=1 Tax=Facklamia sp. 7083-14-GEN3 TaxID=2973478 RepID=UPI00215CC5F1|nr:type II CAAX endopeptidase family protein [Facklamia sp. 7083-14-GEN3]MCR8968517.1 CPBP family intramembrane metalloprotease [Facklamia sp. 7083-14-GEN3]
MKKKNIILIISYVFFMFVFPALAVLIGIESTNWFWLALIGMSIVFLIALTLYNNLLKKHFIELKQKTSIMPFLIRIILGYVFIVIIRNLLFQIFGPYIDFDKLGVNQKTVTEMIELFPLYTTFFMVVLFAPLVEELIYRHSIIGSPKLVSKKSKILMTVLSIILFTGFHMTTLSDAIGYLPACLVITYFYWKYERNVVASMSFHFFNNLIGWLMIVFNININ